MTREYEPDDPNFTPRISAVLREDGSFCLSILKRIDGRCLREFFEYEGCDEGKGYFLSTYQGPGSPLPSFQGEPLPIDMPEPEAVWEALNEDNKVYLVEGHKAPLAAKRYKLPGSARLRFSALRGIAAAPSPSAFCAALY